MFVIGLSHHTAPIEVRERVALDEERATAMLRRLTAERFVTEAMAVSTCNRLELYCVEAEGELGAHALDHALESLRFTRADLGRVLYFHADLEAARHLFRVASSLDSLVVGEPQILGQLKASFERARGVGTVGSRLNRVVTRAFRCAKRVRTETTIGTGQVSIATVALDLARQIFDPLGDRTVALVGSGEMGEAIARVLQQAGSRLVIVGRSEQRVSHLAQQVGAEWRLMGDLERTLVEADVVVTSTSATVPIIGYEMVRAVMRRRRGRDLFFVDVAVPRDVEARAGNIDGVYLYNVDDLSGVVSNTQASRREGAAVAERVINDELRKLEQREEVEQVTPTIRSLYDWVGGVLHGEVERSLQGKLRDLTLEEREGLEKLVQAATKRLLHRPASMLRRWTAERPDELPATMELIRELFLPELAAGSADERSSTDASAISSPVPSHGSAASPSRPEPHAELEPRAEEDPR
jgi:glutamyl-tRNA reductase